MDKRKGYVLLLINAGVGSSVSERKRNTPKIFAPPSARRNFFKCSPPNLKSWIRPWSLVKLNIKLHYIIPTISMCSFRYENDCFPMSDI
jgi:hypothetical protein